MSLQKATTFQCLLNQINDTYNTVYIFICNDNKITMTINEFY